MAGLDLTVVWAFIIAFAVAAYVVMDGFDLGIGILFPRVPVGPERDRAMNTVAPIWDGNETWLVLGGGGLLAAFPLAYAIILPAFYAPLIAMLLGLVLRGVAFETRWRDPAHRHLWDAAFAVGSTVAALAQGIVLGGLLQGVKIEGRVYAGGWWDWLSPFSLLTGVSLVCGYALLGSGWLILKSDGRLQQRAYRFALPLAFGLLAAIIAVSTATPFLDGNYYRRWFAWPGVLAAVQMPLLVALTGFLLIRSIAQRQEWMPFVWTLGLFGLTYVGLGISLWPDIIPGRVTIWEAAAPRPAQLFMLIGVMITVPVILGYTGWAYWVFRGKTGVEGYH